MEAAMNSIAVVLEVEMQSESCASDIIVSARGLRGVEEVAADTDSNKLTVIGKVDPLQILEDLRRKTKKKVELVSPPPKNGGAVICNVEDDRKSDEKRPDFDKKTKEALLMTKVELQLGHCCFGCYSKIRKILSDTKGVQEMALNEEKVVVTVKGTMDVNDLMENLKERLTRSVVILSINKEEYSNGKDRENGSGIDGAEKEGSIMEFKSEETSTTMAVFKMPLHCDGCIRKIRKIIRRIKGVQEVRINKGEETVTVKATIDFKTLTETMRKRLKKRIEEGKIEVQKVSQVTKDTGRYSLNKQDHRQETSPTEALEISELQGATIEIIVVCDSNEGTNQNQSDVSSGDVLHKVDSGKVESSPTNVRIRLVEALFEKETADWIFLITSLVMEGVSAFLDQRNYPFASMVLAFAALLLCVIELLDIARREGLAKLKRNCLPCFYCHLNDNSQSSELFMIVHWFGLTSGLWQCLYSIFQYRSVHLHIDNPIRMTLLPSIFLLCVAISKLIRKLEEINCQEIKISMVGTTPQSDLNPSSNRTEIESGVQSNPSEPKDANLSAMEREAGNYGCSHYRRRCKIRAPCCNQIFDCKDCHDEVKNDAEIIPLFRHSISYQEVTKVICYICNAEQTVQQICIGCGVFMGKYCCTKCKLFDDDISKNWYHCDECGNCRNGGTENFFHCKKCGTCHPRSMEDEHGCMENAMHRD